MPRPDIDVFLDDLYQGTMRDANNVVQLTNVRPGPHEIVLLAKNRSGEIIDRRVLSVTAMAPRVARATEPPAALPAAPPVAAAPASAPPPELAAAPPPSRAPAEELPKAGSWTPSYFLAGLVLVAGGFFLRRLI